MTPVGRGIGVCPVYAYRTTAANLYAAMLYLDSDLPVTLVPLERLGSLLDDLRLGEWLHHLGLPVVAQQQLLKGTSSLHNFQGHAQGDRTNSQFDRPSNLISRAYMQFDCSVNGFCNGAHVHRLCRSTCSIPVLYSSSIGV